MKFALLVFALVQISYVEPRYVLVPSCQCMVNPISPAAQVQSCPKPTLLIPRERFSHAYRPNAIPEVLTYSEIHSKAYQHRPQFHDERISYKRDYYPGHYEEDLEIFYGDEDHEVRHRRSVLSGEEHQSVFDEEDYRKYWQDWQGVEEMSEDESTEQLLTSANDESFDDEKEEWSHKGDLQLANVVSEYDVTSAEKREYKEEGEKQKQTTDVLEQNPTNKTKSEDGGQSAIGKKTKRSINDQQLGYQYRPSNKGYCSVLERYSEGGNHLHPNVHADDCTISKNLFFGCNMDLENGKAEETQRKARKAPKTLAQKINELKKKNEKSKNKSKPSKSKNSSIAKKVNKLEKSLKKDNRLRNEEERLERELEATACPCGSFDRNGVCMCQMQPYYYNHHAVPTSMFNSMSYPVPVRRVYHQPTQHNYYTHSNHH